MSSSRNGTHRPNSSHPQQYGYDTNQQGILRQTPPSAQSWHGRRNVYQTPIYKSHPTPLILDPSQPELLVPATNTTTCSPALSRSGVVQKLLDAATFSAGKRTLLTPSQQIQDSRNTAAAFARTAPRAGFLSKLGTETPEFKRRFFVLKPSTHLYYFLSPGDTEPRGCIDLENATVEELEYLPDGRFRFGITMDERRVILEARSEDVGKEWMQALQEERLSQTKLQLQEIQRKHILSQQKIYDLELQLQEYGLVEKDRDGALEDAAIWKHKFQRLNESLRKLTQHLRRSPLTKKDEIVCQDGFSNSWAKQEAKKVVSTENEPDAPTLQQSPRDTSLLDAIDDGEQPIEQLDVPGTHFTALNNVIQQLRENVRLASMEASTAVEDLCVANEKVTALEKRMLKAEKKLCEQWEENCTIRQELKITKQEKKALVKEIKLSRTNSAPTMMQGRQVELHEKEDILFDIGPEGERLIEELEEQLLSSIALNKQLSDANTRMTENGSLCVARNLAGNIIQTEDSVATLRTELSTVTDEASTRASPLKPKILSLFDEDSEGEESLSEEVYSAGTSCVSSVGAELGEDEFRIGNGDISDDDSGIERKHPILKLDEVDDEDSSQPNLYPESSQSESTTSVVTDNGQATSRLVCPLVDVVDSSVRSSAKSNDGRVYHLSFYSRKIGIQFQKVPSTNTSNGALTEAMTADLPRSDEWGTKTATELRRIAEISRRVKATSDIRGDTDHLQVAMSSDSVLVCGFNGFDDTANHSRPKLGARLVAFDGISVEIGIWTFDSIRKAIQARGRPMTLSFRNDFLTMQQRAILTKAIVEVDSTVPPPRKTIQYRHAASAVAHHDEALRSASSSSHESDQFVHGNAPMINYDDDDMSTSVASSKNPYHDSAYSNSGSVHGNNFRSFSEAGASSVISATIGPLMANLMTGLATKNLDKIPNYLNGSGEAVHNMQEFNNFKASLL